MTTPSANNSVFRGFFEKQKLNGPNFIDLYRQLRIILSIEDKLNYLEQPIPFASVALAGQHVAPKILATYTAWIKGSKEIAGLMLMTMEPEIQRYLENLHAHKMLLELKTLFAQQAEQELLQTTRDFHSCEQIEGQSVSSYVLKMKGYIDNLERLGNPVILGLGTVNELHAMVKIHEKTLPKNNAPALHAILAGKVQKVNKQKKPQPQMAARGQNHGKEKNKLAYSPKPKIPPLPKREDPQRTQYVMSMTAASILNMVPMKKVEHTPYKVRHGQASKLSYLNVWGCEVLVKRDTLTKPDKLEPISIKCIFIGYPKETIGYSFYNPPENKVLVARNVKFLENCLITQEASESLKDLEIIQEEDTHPSIDTSLNHEKNDLEIYEPQSDIIPIRWFTRTRHAPDRMYLYINGEEHELGDLGEPSNYKAELLDLESEKWLNAMNVEMQSMKDNEVWLLVELPLTANGCQTAFLNGYLNEEVYMEQPEGFVNPKYLNRNVTSRFQNNLGDLYWTIVKNILKYLKNTKDMFLVYEGYVFILNSGVVDWKTANQSIFATSSAEAEYITAFDASKEALWVRKFIFGLSVVPTIEEPISMYCDNTGAIPIANESRITKGARHFRAKVHYLR
nr:zinc finger, CCHC-type [Tanacetum cinerariifolium]